MGRLAIITNALIIAYSGEFIPKMVYKFFYSQDQTLKGYVDFSLSHFHTSDMDAESKVDLFEASPSCRYAAYRTGHADVGAEPYSPNIKMWQISFFRLLFVVGKPF